MISRSDQTQGPSESTPSGTHDAHLLTRQRFLYQESDIIPATTLVHNYHPPFNYSAPQQEAPAGFSYPSYDSRQNANYTSPTIVISSADNSQFPSDACASTTRTSLSASGQGWAPFSPASRSQGSQSFQTTDINHRDSQPHTLPPQHSAMPMTSFQGPVASVPTMLPSHQGFSHASQNFELASANSLGLMEPRSSPLRRTQNPVNTPYLSRGLSGREMSYRPEPSVTAPGLAMNDQIPVANDPVTPPYSNVSQLPFSQSIPSSPYMRMMSVSPTRDPSIPQYAPAQCSNSSSYPPPTHLMPSAGVYPSTAGRRSITGETQNFVPNRPSPAPLNLDALRSTPSRNMGLVQRSPTSSLRSNRIALTRPPTQGSHSRTPNPTFLPPPALLRRLVPQTPPQDRYSGSHRVYLSLDGIPGIPADPSDPRIFSRLDNSDSLVLSELGEVRIHLNIYWPQYRQIGAYLTVKTETSRSNNTQTSESRSPITLSAFAKAVSSRVEKMLKDLERTKTEGSGEWKLGQVDGIRRKDIWILSIYRVTQHQWIPELEVRSSV
ncbi:hypothetical protein ABKN59_003664 [Abortiporus biennis]